jgi:hypothetical protein
VGSYPPCLDAAGYRLQVSGLILLVLTLMLVFAGFGCVEEQAGHARGEKGG